MSVESTGPAGATVIDSVPAPAGSGFLHRLLMTLGPILAALVLAGAIGFLAGYLLSGSPQPQPRQWWR